MYRTNSGSDSDSDDGEINWKRASRKLEHPEEAIPESRKGAENPMGARKRNHIWGDVAQEQSLMEDMRAGFGVEDVPENNSDRGSEAYDYRRSRLDARPEVEPLEIEGVPESLIKLREERAKKVKQRLGPTKTVDEIKKEVSSEHEVTVKIAARLKEKKIHLIRKCVDEVGIEKCLQTLSATETIEANGGLMINNGTRRRTPGGVFLHLLRSDKNVSKESLNRIFEDEREERKIALKRKKRTAIEKRAAKVIKTLQAEILGDEVSSSSSSGQEVQETEMKCAEDPEDGEIVD